MYEIAILMPRCCELWPLCLCAEVSAALWESDDIAVERENVELRAFIQAAFGEHTKGIAFRKLDADIGRAIREAFIEVERDRDIAVAALERIQHLVATQRESVMPEGPVALTEDQLLTAIENVLRTAGVPGA